MREIVIIAAAFLLAVFAVVAGLAGLALIYLSLHP